MEKSLGNKRRRVGDPSDEKTRNDPDQIGEISKIFGNYMTAIRAPSRKKTRSRISP